MVAKKIYENLEKLRVEGMVVIQFIGRCTRASACILLAFIGTNGLQAKELARVYAKPKKHNLSICAVFRNEAPYLKEWIEYHRLIGVDHFYLYNNNSVDRFREVLNPYIKQGIVSLVQWPDRLGTLIDKYPFMWTLSTQIPAYENAAGWRTPKETKWLAFVDIDEFLVPADGNTIIEILERHDESPGVVLPIICFDASSVDTLPKRTLIIETVELTAPPELNVQNRIEKMIFKPDYCRGFTCSPYRCLFKDGLPIVNLGMHEIRINRYVDRNKGGVRSRKGKLSVDNRLLSESEMKYLLEADYEIEDQDRTIFRFVPELFMRMGYGQRLNW